ncbi:MAG: Preprotein translocase, SecE subunit [Candidatus Uhrbacteria bacterium GW2011_GWD2_52_7]|uniref:Protein translocase subunit SecE n=1 Tax=Candidatus Uhrbacteria bacterium GW2011_GWD2_52_7 TaxID=1618989 RepID=A0A0G1XBH9_9BACT|nr:MAG: Preprotein translocase, SecE subunit [Candidatus Uhrbacteria bacterium GW2011_GWD2_52_7]
MFCFILAKSIPEAELRKAYPPGSSLALAKKCSFSYSLVVPREGILKYMVSLSNNLAVRYFREAYEELKKVAWPTKRETLLYSGIVIGLCLALAVYFGLIDWLLTKGLELLVNLAA